MKMKTNEEIEAEGHQKSYTLDLKVNIETYDEDYEVKYSAQYLGVKELPEILRSFADKAVVKVDRLVSE